MGISLGVGDASSLIETAHIRALGETLSRSAIVSYQNW